MLSIVFMYKLEDINNKVPVLLSLTDIHSEEDISSPLAI